MISSLLLGVLVTIAASAQALTQGVLSNGNSNLPSCAQSCPLLIQAAQACSATNTATQANWICFCQSAYLTTLRSSAVGICDSTCTNPTDNNQISTWYNSNCGSDNGASEHAAGDAAATGVPTTTTAGGAASTAKGGSAATAGSGATASSAPVDTSFKEQCAGDWWTCHYKWIIMLIVLAILLPLLGWGAHYLKRRHDRKVDRMSGGFNAGITERAAPMSKEGFNDSDMVAAAAAAAASSSGRPGSPARTRDQFMPYGYGYTHSDSRTGVARGGTPDVEKERGPAESPRNPRRVLVREKSATDSSDGTRF
ncbi:uncharacterized protein MYCFIDRAFT_86910 [Pseudocercospora fijiensis CIRAD86]|uniref:Extracellular membrane protein CFEM domain-containing protein n=1 Tax=Pseudocercospora fijiensis (strain CIRAD86) TaxID=383855 RepID=M2YRY9_PSEFD|nr:uncharacterized protein MYCFIDRAFT_86910 [Pseudocercospora fijiensis CIRAD86]EME80510.1 hypothetical protein MYCFIDRAFT_86910 [Pseudocercospora fijiensis CIRAD86]